jgi:hypothetical protein
VRPSGTGRLSEVSNSMRKSTMGNFIHKYRDSKILVLPDEKDMKRYQNMIPDLL